jgi:hypothetical protein
MIVSPFGSARTQTTTLDTLSLYDLPGVHVVVEPFEPAAESDGLYRDSLLQSVESKLIDAGVRLLNQQEWQMTLGNPLLLLRLNLLRPSRFFYLYSIELELQQLVVLARDSTIPAFTTTWQAGDIVGTVPAANLPSLRTQVLTAVARFIVALTAARGIRRSPSRLDSPRWPGLHRSWLNKP